LFGPNPLWLTTFLRLLPSTEPPIFNPWYRPHPGVFITFYYVVI
jgi:hypothetical protein